MPGPIFLEGEEVELRTVEEEDIEFLRDSVNLPVIRRNILSVRKPENRDSSEDFFENVVCSDDTVHFLICKDGERAGIISVEDKGSVEKLGQLGLWIHPDYHNQGLGTESTELLIDHAFEQLDYHKLYARVHENNEASQSLWEKLEFEEEGRLKEHCYVEGEYLDVIMYGMLRREWR